MTPVRPQRSRSPVHVARGLLAAGLLAGGLVAVSSVAVGAAARAASPSVQPSPAPSGQTRSSQPPPSPVATSPAPSPSPAGAPARPGATPDVADPAIPNRWATAPVGPSPWLVFHGDRRRQVIALTFDDGYAPDNVRRIFAILQSEHVPATFFVNGWYLSRAPALWREIAAAGYPIGDHTYYHEDVTHLSSAAIATELLTTASAVRRVTRLAIWPIFRPPYGARNEATDAAAAAAGFPTIVMWDVSALDSERGVTVARVVAAASAGRPGSIVLLHAGPSVTPKALPAIIAAYRHRGFDFVTIPELLGIPGPAVSLPPLPVAGGTTGPAGAAVPAGDDVGLGSTAGGGSPANRAATASPGPGTSGTNAKGNATTVRTIERPSPPPARAGAWARSDDALAAAGEVSLGLVGLLVVTGALAGRRRRPAPAGEPVIEPGSQVPNAGSEGP